VRSPSAARLAAGLLLLVLPACGKRGDPLPPLPRTPQAVTGFTLGQRGPEMEVAMVAPRLTAGGARLGVMELELVRLDGPGDLDKTGKKQRFKVGPGERIVEHFPLPAPCISVRMAVRAIHGGERSPLSKPLTLVVSAPPAAPPTLAATLRPSGVLLAWTLPVTPSPAPTPCPTPTPSPHPSASPGVPAASAARGARPAPAVSPSPSPSGGAPTVAAVATPGASPSPSAAATPTPPPSPTPPPPPRVRLYRRGPLGEAALLVPDALAGANYEDTTAPQGQTWCYVARTVLGTDPLVESVESAPACVEVKDVFAPAPPGGLSVLAQESDVEVSWSPSPEGDLKAYRLYRSSGGGPPQRLAELERGTTTTHDKPPAGAVSVYTLTAVDQNGNESPPSAGVSIRRP